MLINRLRPYFNWGMVGAVLLLLSTRPVLAMAEAKNQCPEAGTKIPFAQLISQTEIFKGCDVTTEVQFIAAGQGGNALSVFDLSGQTIFQVIPLGQRLPDADANNISFAGVPHAAAAVIFSAATGDRLLMRGRMDYKRFEFTNIDSGVSNRLFRAEWIKPAK